MNTEKIMTSIDGISDKYIEEYAVVKPKCFFSACGTN